VAASRNKTPLVGWHPSAGLVAWLDAEVERRGGGRGVRSAILEEALDDYRRRHEGTPPEPAGLGRDEVPVVKSGSRPQVAVAVPDRSEEKAEARSPVLAPEDPAPKARNCKHPKVRVKGVCPDCQEWVVK
jgi:hypothetical protein